MGDSVTTRPSLLLRIRDARDSHAWTQFVDLYAPLVYGFGRKRGLQDADAADLTQEVLRAVSSAVGRLEYDPKRGSFRGWLFTIVRSKLNGLLARRRRPGQGCGDTTGNDVLAQQPAPVEDPDEQWRHEYEQRLFAWAAEQVRGTVHETTWQAFWQTAVEGKSGKAVAEALGLSVSAVYLARGRVMARLKEKIRQVQEE